jgi:hypothetical protein
MKPANVASTLTLAAGSSVTENVATVYGGIVNGGTVSCTDGRTVTGNTANDSPVANDCIDVGGSDGNTSSPSLDPTSPPRYE